MTHFSPAMLRAIDGYVASALVDESGIGLAMARHQLNAFEKTLDFS